MKSSELRELNVDELTQKLEGLKRGLLDLRMQRAGGKLAKPHQIHLARKDVARILTLINEKERKG